VQLPERDVPDYIEADHSKMTATFVRTPGLGDVPYPVQMEPNLVIEYSGTVPALHHGEVRISEALAILEYVADLHPDRGFWPAGIGQRAKARSISAEMAAGFRPLRNECPMNFAREVRAIDVSDGVRRDVARIEQIWSRCLEASGGPFLFGEFCNADAMYAPVVNRLEIYALSDHPAVKAYTAAMQALPAWAEWAAAGKAEPWIYPEDEA
jgi:glutathione S-transferase